MNEAIKDLLTSDNEEDIRLGILIAKQQNISAENVWNVFLMTLFTPRTTDTWLGFTELYREYIEHKVQDFEDPLISWK